MPAAGLPCPSPLFGGFSLIADETRVRAACKSAWRLLASRSWPRRCDNYIFMDRIAGWPCARCFHYRRVIAWSNPSLPLAVHSRVYSDLIERRPLELRRTCNSLHLATWPLLFIYVIRLSLNYSAVSCGLHLMSLKWMSKLNYIEFTPVERKFLIVCWDSTRKESRAGNALLMGWSWDSAMILPFREHGSRAVLARMPQHCRRREAAGISKMFFITSRWVLMNGISIE